MTTTNIALDFELARKIMFRQEELYDSETFSLPAHFQFEGYTPEKISYNIKKLNNAKLIVSQLSQEWYRGKLMSWPTGITEHGWRFLAAAKDEKKWSEAVRAVEQQGDAATIGRLAAELCRGDENG